jgi:hypothetical protein
VVEDEKRLAVGLKKGLQAEPGPVRRRRQPGQGEEMREGADDPLTAA